VTGIRVRHDAISNLVGLQHDVLTEAGYDVRILVHHSDSSGSYIESEFASVWGLVCDPFYRSADLVVFHFGIQYGLFDALLLPHPNHAVRVVQFHNVTPPELLSGETAKAAGDGLLQMTNVVRADAVWSVSPHNTESLLMHTDVDPSIIEQMDLCVPGIDEVALVDRRDSTGPVKVLGVGRFVAAKGQGDLLDAIETLGSAARSGLQVDLAGSVDNSDVEFIDELEDRLAATGLRGTIRLRRDPSDLDLARLYARADIFVTASRHEGFCVPVIEAIAAGCRVVATDSGALPDTIGPCGHLVAAGDPVALAGALSSEIDQVRRSRAGDAGADDRLRGEVRSAHLARFARPVFRLRLVQAVEALVGPVRAEGDGPDGPESGFGSGQ